VLQAGIFMPNVMFFPLELRIGRAMFLTDYHTISRPHREGGALIQQTTKTIF